LTNLHVIGKKECLSLIDGTERVILMVRLEHESSFSLEGCMSHIVKHAYAKRTREV